MVRGQLAAVNHSPVRASPGVTTLTAVTHYRRSAERFLRVLPHVAALHIQLDCIEPARCTLSMDYREELVGDPATGVLHGGAVTTLIDTVFGLAVYTALSAPAAIATLDLRIDYLRPATAGLILRADGHCFRTTRQIAFVRGVAFHDEPSAPVAAAQGCFMISALAQSGVAGGQPT